MAGPTQRAARRPVSAAAGCLLLVALLLLAAFNSGDAFAFVPPACRLAAPSPLVTRTGGSSSSPLARSTLRSHPAAQRRLLVQLRSGGAIAYDLLKDPEEMYESAVERGVKKASSPVWRTFLLAIQAGFQVGIGAAFAVATLAGLQGLSTSNPALAKLVYGAVGLPCGLLMTATTGTMLFTGNTCLCGVAFMEGKITGKQLLTNWLTSFLGNLLGCSLLAALCTYAGVFHNAVPAIVNVSAYKGSLPFGVALARGVLCNWLVCTAVYIAQGCRDLASKASIILLVITIFAALGFEHSVANMWLGPFAAMNGGQPFSAFFLRNLIPVTAGNIVAGFFIVAGTYHLAYGSPSKKREPRSRGYE